MVNKKIAQIIFYNKFQFILITILNLITTGIAVGSGLIYGELLNLVVNQEPLSVVINYSIFAVGYTLFSSFLAWLYNYLYGIFLNKSILNLRNKFMSNLMYSKFFAFKKSDPASYFSQINHDIPLLGSLYYGNIIGLMSNVFILIYSALFIFIISWQIGLFMVSICALMGIFPLILHKPLDKSNVQVSNINKSYFAQVKEKLYGYAVIKSVAAENMACEDVEKINNDLFGAQKKVILVNGLAGGLGNMVRDLGSIVSAIIAAIFVFNNMLEVGVILSVLSISAKFYTSILGIANSVAQFGGSKTISSSLEKTLLIDKCNESNAEEIISEIEIKDLDFSYGDKNFQLHVDALKIEKNKKYLVVGASGCGKSTLIKIIYKFYEGYQGEISANGVNYKELNYIDINKHITICLQESFLFNKTMRDNIVMDEKDDQQKITDILKTVCLEKVVDGLEYGLDTKIDEDVNQLSGGEKLRVNLARSLYTGKEILLLDEVTSALDLENSKNVEKNLLMLKDKTIINISHKINFENIYLYDKVILMKEGKIILFEEPENIINKKEFSNFSINEVVNDKI